MARKKDLAGLATLAGLAYMATRDKGGEGSTPSAPAATSTAEQSSGGDFMSEKEPGWDSGTEGGSSSRLTASTAKTPAAKPSAAKPMGGSGRGGRGGATAEELAAYAASKKPAYESSYDRSRREDREAGRDIGSVVEGLKNRIATAGERGSALPLKSTKADKNEFMGPGMKKGGSVKGWGIARGARKAKTY